MKALNYNHLYYFWAVAREGGGRPRERGTDGVSQPTISSQLKALEGVVGQKLFARAGRGLALTEAGRIAFNYANEMFSLGQETPSPSTRRRSMRRWRRSAPAAGPPPGRLGKFNGVGAGRAHATRRTGAGC